MERVIDVSGYGCKLRIDTGRLAIEPEQGERRLVALRDVALVMLSDSAVSVSGATLAELASCGAVVVVCDGRHLPVAVCQPTNGHSLLSGTLMGQIRSRSTVRARLWQALIRAKISSQAWHLRDRSLSDVGFRELADGVTRGDRHNAEGAAAHEYWRRLAIFDRRDRFADDANKMLNYAYAIVHSATVRALCAAGLNTALGLHHANPTNPHCLASDVMEPFRVAADRAVCEWLKIHPNVYEMSRACRQALVEGVVSSCWRTRGGRLPLFAALSHLAVSLRECLCGNVVALEIPEIESRRAA